MPKEIHWRISTSTQQQTRTLVPVSGVVPGAGEAQVNETPPGAPPLMGGAFRPEGIWMLCSVPSARTAWQDGSSEEQRRLRPAALLAQHSVSFLHSLRSLPWSPLEKCMT